ncbi:hypothetical protein ABFX02_06G050400 [Erythranthe guttata]
MASKKQRQEFLVQKTDEENMRPVKRIGPRFQADLPPFTAPARSKDDEESIRSSKRIGLRFQADLPLCIGPACSKDDEENIRPVRRIGPRFQDDLPRFIDEEKIRPVKRIGPRFQAKLPQFMGLARYKADKSNLKWLGTKIWPVESNQKNDDYALRTTMDLLYDCACQDPITKSSSTRKRQRDEE